MRERPGARCQANVPERPDAGEERHRLAWRARLGGWFIPRKAGYAQGRRRWLPRGVRAREWCPARRNGATVSVGVRTRDVVVNETVTSLADATALRRAVEAELSELVPQVIADDVVAALGELIACGCHGGSATRVRVARHDAVVRVEVRCPPASSPDATELARRVLAATTRRWGVNVGCGSVRFWGEVDTL